MEAKAVLRLARVSARKAGLVADMIRGKEVGEALEQLAFTRKKSAALFKTLLESAVANAEHQARETNQKLDIDALVVKEATANQGPSLKRYRPRAHGRAYKILKKTAHLTVVVEA